MSYTPLGPPDYALSKILQAWFEVLRTNDDMWAAMLSNYPPEVVSRARSSFLNDKARLRVMSGFPRTNEPPPIIAVVLLTETPETDYLGQAAGLVESYDDNTELMEQIGDVSVSSVGVMVIAPNDELGHIYSSLVRKGCLIAQRRMLESGFVSFSFGDASDLAPAELQLPQDYWVRTYTYVVMEQNDASMTLPDGIYVPAVVEIALKAIIGLEPPLNSGGVTALPNV
jgi:hypothetical protein